MIIGIYGDSYASTNGDNAVKWFELLAEKLQAGEPVKKPWWSLFGKKETETPTSKCEIKNYSRAGSSLFYTYTRFLKTHQNHDLNIVLVTGTGRYPKTVRINRNEYVFTTEVHTEQIAKLVQDAGNFAMHDMKKLADIKAWFRASDNEFNVQMHELMLKEMESLNSNTIYYPCFGDSFDKARAEKFGLDIQNQHMHMFWHRQLHLLNLPPDGPEVPETPNMCGHMGPEFNEFFAEMLYKRIKTGKWDHSGLLDVTLKNPLNFYYKVD